MTNEERKALVERLRWGHWYFDDPFDGKAYASDDPLEAADQIEADGQRIAELEAALRSITGGTYPRPLGKPWRMDASSSKHDRCIHDKWMYETCENCLDAFASEALGNK